MLLVAALVASCGTAVTRITSAGDPDTNLAELFDYPPDPLDIHQVGTTSENGVQVHDISFAGNGEARVEAFLVEPAGEGPFGGVVFMHWGGGSRYQFLDEAVALAGDGLMSLLIDAEWQPQRQHFVDTVIALRRGADLLSEHAEVDDTRLGYVGHSWGASFGVVLAAVDERFAAYVLMAGVPSLATFLGDPDLDVFDAAPYLAAAESPALFFQAATEDENVLPELAQGLYEAAGEPKSIMWYPTTHRFADQEAAEDRVLWLRSRLAGASG